MSATSSATSWSFFSSERCFQQGRGERVKVSIVAKRIRSTFSPRRRAAYS
jgi:hypothetical protein